MSISYSAITNYGKATLPSVDSWNTNMSILKDPPKSIWTRRIDKVGDTSQIVEAIDGSENRFAEAIRVYARGINPSVSVSYQNNNVSSGNVFSNNSSIPVPVPASLPYKVGDSFRAPVATQKDRLPISNMNRIWTSAWSQPGFTDFSKKMSSCGTNFDIKPSIQQMKHNITYSTNVKGMGSKGNEELSDAKLPMLKNPTRTAIDTNLSAITKTDHIYENFTLDRKIPISENNFTNKSSHEYRSISHEHMKERGRNIPLAQISVNDRMLGGNSYMNRDVHLKDKISNAGEFEPTGSMKSFDRTAQIREEPFMNDKSVLGRKAYEQFAGRYAN